MIRCPVEPGVFPALERSPERSKSLVAPFQAFRFASDAAVKFQLTVSFCLDTCQPVSHVNRLSNRKNFIANEIKQETSFPFCSFQIAS